MRLNLSFYQRRRFLSSGNVLSTEKAVLAFQIPFLQPRYIYFEELLLYLPIICHRAQCGTSLANKRN